MSNVGGQATQLKENSFISAEDGMITIGAFSYLAEKSSLVANQKATISTDNSG